MTNQHFFLLLLMLDTIVLMYGWVCLKSFYIWCMWCIVFPKSPPFLGLLCDLLYNVVSSVINFSKTKNLSQSLLKMALVVFQSTASFFRLLSPVSQIIRLYEDIKGGIQFASCLWQKLNYLRKTFLKRSLKSFTFGCGVIIIPIRVSG